MVFLMILVLAVLAFLCAAGSIAGHTGKRLL
jgi:hypothetical protein